MRSWNLYIKVSGLDIARGRHFTFFLNYVLIATDAGELGVHLLLHLLAAFDTVHHEILIGRLEQWAGLLGKPYSGCGLPLQTGL